MNRQIFVFGSNLAGRHGKGSAREARLKWGAVYGVGMGRTGNAYAIPTKDEVLKVLPSSVVNAYIQEFRTYAEEHPDLDFIVVKIGCGLAGFKEEEIAPLFRKFPENCILPPNWRTLNGEKEAEPRT